MTSIFVFMWKWIFWWNLLEVVAYQSSAHRFARSFDLSWVSELKYDIGKNQHVPNLFLCEAADLNQRPAGEKGVCSDSNWTAQLLQMMACKSLETMSRMILNRMQPKLTAQSVAMFESDVVISALTGQASIFNFKIFRAICLLNDHLLCYWPTIHNSILKICPEFQVLWIWHGAEPPCLPLAI